jgi:PilZ domain
MATLQSVCGNVGIIPTVCSEDAQAAEMLARCKFYGVIIDSAKPEVAMEVLSTVRASSSSRKAIAIVVSDASGGVPGGMFVLSKPVAVDLATRTLRAATGLMLNEFRRYFRHPVQLPVVITRDSGGELQATSINFSHGGLAVRMAALDVIAPGDAFRARFTRPGAGARIETKGRVAWIGAQGRAGLHCECISARDRKQLEEWLAQQFAGDDLPRRTAALRL